MAAQRAFRIHQLQQLASLPSDATTDPARAEVHLALRTAARSALRDIEAALSRIRDGGYGRCLRCGETMSVSRLRALPMTPLCGRCHRTTAMSAGVPGPSRERSRSV